MKNKQVDLCVLSEYNHPIEAEDLILLARCPRSEIRIALGYYPHLTTDTQLLLAEDKEVLVLQALAANPNLAPETQYTLVKRGLPIVHRELMKNPNVPEKIRNQLKNNISSII